MYARSFSLRLTAALGLLLAAAPLAAQELPEGYDQGLFQIVIPRVGSSLLVVLVNPQGEVLLPLAPVLRLASIPHVVDSAGTTLRAPGPAGRDTATLRLPSSEIERSDTTIALAPDEARLHEGELYLAAPRLAQLLRAQARVDWSSLQVVLDRDPPFPAQRQAELDQRRRLAMVRTQGSGGELPDVPLRTLSGGGVLHWTFSAAALNPLRTSQLFTQAGAAVLGGRATLGVGLGTSQATGAEVNRISGSYERVFPGEGGMSRLALGDIVTGGLVARSIRGVSVTNSPFTRSPQFDQIVVQPDIPAGWQFEVYQEGRLVGFSDPVSGGPVQVPLSYGTTPIEVRMYGPAGEAVVSELLYQIPGDHLPDRRLEYAAGAGLCPGGRCDALGYGAIDYGIARWLTLGTGGEITWDSAGGTARFSARGSIAPEGSWMAQFQALQGSFVQGNVRWTGNPLRSASVGAALRSPGFGQPTFLPGDGSRWDLNVNGRYSPLNGGLRVSGLRDGGLDQWRLYLSRPIARGFLQVAYDGVLSEDPALDELDFFSVRLYRLLPRRWLNSATLNAGVRATPERLEGAELGLSVSLGTSGQLGLSTRWQRDRGGELSVSFARALGWGRAQGVVTASGDDVLRTAYTLDGGFALDAGTPSVTAVGSFAIGFAGVRGRVFYDYDGDGRFGVGDEPASDIQVRAGGRPGRTDANGVYHLWAVPPYDPVVVALDTVASFLPTWVAKEGRQVLRPVPHIFNDADFPLVRTRELIGELVAETGVPTPGGVTLEITNLATGEIREALTFSDGQFYVSRLGTGEYEMALSEGSLEALRARAIPERVRFVVEARGDDPFVEVPPIRLVRRTVQER